jgi:hypothetical protein
MPKVPPIDPLDQLDFGFGSKEDLKLKKQTPVKLGPSEFDKTLERVTEQEAERVRKQMKTDQAKAEVRAIADEFRAKEKADLEKKPVGSGRPIYFATDPKGLGGGGKGLKKTPEFRKGGRVKTASQRADGCAIRGKTRA